VVLPIVSDPHAAPLIVLYVGPDQIMPLASIFGAIVGLALMFWNRVVGLASRCWAAVVRRSDPGHAPGPRS
jgi:hypothetical protein